MAVSSPAPVYTVCDESRYLIVKNVPALGCIDELVKLFSLYGPIEEYRLMDEEDCEPFTDVYWIKFVKISNARFAKRKLDNYNFLGNLLQVTYAPTYETPLDTKDKLEERRSVVLNRITSEKREVLKQTPPWHRGKTDHVWEPQTQNSQLLLQANSVAQMESVQPVRTSNQHFPSVSMNATVQTVRQKLHQISSVGVVSRDVPSRSLNNPCGKQVDLKQHEIHSQLERKPDGKKPRIDNRPRI